MMLPSHGPEPCASANSATSAYCGRWDLNPHEHTPTRSLVLPVCQFQHSRLLFFNFLCPMIFSPTKSSIAQFHLNCKPVFHKFISEFIESEYSKTRHISVPGYQSCRRRDLNLMMLPSHGPEPCASANSATSAHWGEMGLETHTSIHPQDP